MLQLGTPLPGYRPATSWVHYTTSCNTQSGAPEDGRDQRPKHVELIGTINKPLLLHLVGVYIRIDNFKNIIFYAIEKLKRWDANTHIEQMISKFCNFLPFREEKWVSL